MHTVNTRFDCGVGGASVAGEATGVAGLSVVWEIRPLLIALKLHPEHNMRTETSRNRDPGSVRAALRINQGLIRHLVGGCQVEGKDQRMCIGSRYLPLARIIELIVYQRIAIQKGRQLL